MAKSYFDPKKKELPIEKKLKDSGNNFALANFEKSVSNYAGNNVKVRYVIKRFNDLVRKSTPRQIYRVVDSIMAKTDGKSDDKK